MVVLIAAVAGALVAGLTAHVMLGPERRAQRLVTLARLRGLQAELEARRPRTEDECPLCVAQHRDWREVCVPAVGGDPR